MTDEIVYIRDNILGNETNASSNKLEYIDNFCIAFCEYLGNTLLNKDQNDCLLTLLNNHSSIDDVIIEKAEKAKNSLSIPELLE